MLGVGIDGLHARSEGIDQHVDFRNRHGADGADDVRLRHLAGEHAGEIGAVVVPSAENAEVAARFLAARTENEGGLRIVGGDFAGLLFNGIGFADDELCTLLGIFAHCAGIIRARNAFGEDILDHAFGGRILQRLVQDRVPGVLDRGGVDTSNLDRRAGAHGGRQGAHAKHQARRKHIAPAHHQISCHGWCSPFYRLVESLFCTKFCQAARMSRKAATEHMLSYLAEVSCLPRERDRRRIAFAEQARRAFVFQLAKEQ